MSASLQESFGPFERAWLNTAHQGPLPLAAADASRLAVEEKLDPRRISEEAFFEGPAMLRSTLGRLIAADPAEIVLGNSTSYGLDLLAHGLPLQAGDEVLLVGVTSRPRSTHGCHCSAAVCACGCCPRPPERLSPTIFKRR